MRNFRPLFWPTVISLPTLIVLIGLGTWQVQRLQWKTALNDERAAQLAAPVLSLAEMPQDPAAAAYRRVAVSGRFAHDKEMYLAARSLNRNVGYHVITPMALTEGGWLLVNRGWVPHEQKAPESRAAGQVTGDQKIEGLLRLTQTPALFTPDNRPDENIWFYTDIPAMAAWTGLENVRPWILDAGPAPNPGGLPIGGQTRTELRNFHLQYAITWYALAIGLIVIYLLYHRRPAGDR